MLSTNGWTSSQITGTHLKLCFKGCIEVEFFKTEGSLDWTLHPTIIVIIVLFDAYE